MKNTIKMVAICKITKLFALISMIYFALTACVQPPDNSIITVKADKTALVTAISSAENTKAGVVVNTAASNVPVGQKWVTAGEMAVFDSAITTAKGVNDNEKAVQAAVNSAISTLTSAINTFNSAKKSGTAVNNNINNAALAAKITEAEILMNSMTVASDGSQVAVGSFYVTPAVKTTLENAIDAAKNIHDTATVQSVIDAAVTTLNSAMTTFTNARQEGTQGGGFTQPQLTQLIADANAAKTGVTSSANGNDVSPSESWVTSALLTALNNAITAAGSATDANRDERYLTLSNALTAFNNGKHSGNIPDKTALQSAIISADTAKTDVVIAANAAQAASGSKWATQAQWTPFNTAYENAVSSLNNINATVNAVNAATSALTNATTTFITAVSSNGPGGIPPGVSNVTVSPSNISIIKGQSHTFTATVTVTGSASQNVTWSITTAGKHAQTTINSSGTITINQNETLSTLTVRATSTYDTGKFGEAVINIITNVLWVDPCTQTTQLTSAIPLTQSGGGNNALPQTSPYGFEIFIYEGGGGSMAWYGPNQGGGGAFKATWDGYYLARLGYFWGNGGQYTQYKNMYADFNFTRTGNNTSNGGMIGLYGWSRNPSAAKESDRLIEWYIVDDWLYNNDGYQMTINNVDNPNGERKELGTYYVDGTKYTLVYTVREDQSIDGRKLFAQIVGIRDGARRAGTIPVTEHFDEWAKLGVTLGNMYEVKFKVESFGLNGTLDLTYMHLSQEDNKRPAGEICSGNCNSGGDEPINTGVDGIQIFGNGFTRNTSTGIITLDSGNDDRAGVIAIPVPSNIRSNNNFTITISDINIDAPTAGFVVKIPKDNGTIDSFGNWWEVIADTPTAQYPGLNTTITINLTGVSYKDFIFMQHNNWENPTAKYSFKVVSVTAP